MSKSDTIAEESLRELSDIPVYTPKQEAILLGAVQVFLRLGYAGTSMDRVAAEAGVSKQTIYSHFQDKEGLFKALMEQMTIRRFQAAFQATTLQGEPEAVLRQFAETYLKKIDDKDYLALFRVIFAESVRFPELAKLYGRTVIQQGRHFISDYFHRHPELGFTDPEAIAQVFIGSLVSYVIAQEIFYGKETIPLERDRLIDSLMSLMLNKIADKQ
jgi:AcrR family transcriptional regulator